jgi:transcriptional regulator with AAA-type ATPase domain
MSDSTAADTAQDERKGGAPLFAVHPHLFIVIECDRPGEGGGRHSLADLDEVVLGRGAERTVSRETVDGVRRLVVTLPGRWVSSAHARMTQVAGRWVLEDASSKNGTFVNGIRVEQAALADGDVFALGRVLFVFRAALPTPPGTPLDVALRGNAGALATLAPLGQAKLEEVRLIARSPVSVLLLGETGTGKEVIARAIHGASGREGELVAVNCGALSATLLEALLFGHVRGAFTGATRDELGLVRAADRGTLFLDEIGDLPRGAQAALLRVLQEREVVPVGSVRPIRVDVRFVAATHRPLESLAATGDFRADLFARLNGFLHQVPPLRDRREDLGSLVAALLPRLLGAESAMPTLSVEACQALFAYGWPSNVRELEQCLARAVALAPSGAIELHHLPDAVAKPGRSSTRPSRLLSKEDELLRAQLADELGRHAGNVSEVARAMGKARMQIQRWLKRFRINASDFRT